MSVYVDLYPEYGGSAKGFRCETCERVTRTLNGMKTHLRRVHGITIQGEMFLDAKRLPAGMAQTKPGVPQSVDGCEAGRAATGADQELFTFEESKNSGSGR